MQFSKMLELQQRHSPTKRDMRAAFRLQTTKFHPKQHVLDMLTAMHAMFILRVMFKMLAVDLPIEWIVFRHLSIGLRAYLKCM